MMQHSPFASPLLPTGKGFFNLAGGYRGGRPRSTTRAQEATSLIDGTLNFFVKATWKDEASMRQQLTSQKREELRRSRDHWKVCAEDEERFQKMKEEARRLFERQPGFKRKTREEFEEELTRKVRNTPGNNRGERPKMVQEWSRELRRVVQPEERRHEAGRFQLPNTTNMGENMGTEDSRPNAAPRTREMSSTSSSLCLSPQWRQPCARIRFGQCPRLHEPREHEVKMSPRCWPRR